jgi:hypothetical protein
MRLLFAGRRSYSPGYTAQLRARVAGRKTEQRPRRHTVVAFGCILGRKV